MCAFFIYFSLFSMYEMEGVQFLVQIVLNVTEKEGSNSIAVISYVNIFAEGSDALNKLRPL